MRLPQWLCPWRRRDEEGQPLFEFADRRRNWFSRRMSTSPSTLEERTILLNQPQDTKFCNNKISTAKYNLFTFIPRFLFEQFRKYANLFFLFIACLQQIPGVSPTGRFTTVFPLAFILFLSALKELVEDVKRHQADNTVNYKSKVLVLKDGQWKSVCWQALQVGDFIKLTDKSLIPADVLLLSSSEAQGLAYIETSNLDGETNLKIRKGVPKTTNVLTATDLSNLSGKIMCEVPNRFLYDFIGTIQLTGQSQVPLGPSELLLRGSKLKNTTWVFGIVIYTGEESKLRLNSVPTPLKRSHIEKLTNIQILLLFGVLVFLSLTTSMANLVWTNRHGDNVWYEDVADSNFLKQFLTYVILYNNLIPISLQVTLEFVKFVQAYFINWDSDMYYEPTDTPAMARTSNLNEELGQIKYIFSDKTGTLTRNVMEFKGASIKGTMYRDDGASDCLLLSDITSRVSEKHKDAAAIDRFMRFLVLCHTVVPEEHKDNSEYTYQASSPDEAALVSGAAKLGWIFTARTPEYLTIKQNGVEETYQLLNVIDFTSSRKRMSVIVRLKNGTIKLLCKGADSVIIDRLAPGQALAALVEDHLDQFATVGLRTLCLAEVVITEKRYQEWSKKYNEACCSLSNREKNIADAAELIERHLLLLGATAIEDKLQEGVPECIASLAKADIKIWVLTGDKQETAINIGYSCHLLTKNMPLMLLNASSHGTTRAQLDTMCEEFGPQIRMDNNVGFIIDGHTLKYALRSDCMMNFLKVAVSCKAVICCRVSPLQKAEIVALVKKYVGAITLAIGDGANDVGMIQAADVGVGINGVEGTQAVCAADYSLGQFRFLKKLLLVHGTWNYYRVCKLILYSFYKNICLYVVELWFQMYNGFSGQILFERWSIGLYNVMFTATPPLVLGLLDRYTSPDIPVKYPQMYKISQDSTLFNVKVFWMWMMNSIFHSCLLYFLPLLMLKYDNSFSDGQVGGYLYLGNYVFGFTVITVCVKAGLEAYTWTAVHFITVIGSILSWFLYLVIYSSFWPEIPIGSSAEIDGQAVNLFRNPRFWLGCVIIPIAVLLRDIIWKIVRRTFFASIKEQVEEFDSIQNKIKLQRSGPQSLVTAVTESTERGRATNRVAADIAAARLLKKIFAPAATYQFHPSQQSLVEPGSALHGYAFSQDEVGAVRPSQIVRMVDSRAEKPGGL